MQRVVFIVLTGPLCTAGAVPDAQYNMELDHFGNLVRILLARTSVGICSRMDSSKLDKMIQCILPNNIVSKLFWVQGYDLPEKSGPHPHRVHFFRDLLSKDGRMRHFLRNKTIVFIDVDPLNMQQKFVIYPFVRIVDATFPSTE